MAFTAFEIAAKINEMASGLICVSEADYPFEAFVLDPQRSIVDQLLDYLPDFAQVYEDDEDGPPMELAGERISLSEFRTSCRPIMEDDWDNREEAELRFEHILDFIQLQLTDVSILVVGVVQVYTFVIGTAPNGQLVVFTATQVLT
jgi:hypothetical protein